MPNPMLALRYVYCLKYSDRTGNFASAPKGPFYRAWIGEGSLNTEEPLVLRGLHLPLHMDSDPLAWRRKQKIDSASVSDCDTWRYAEFFTVEDLGRDSHVEAFLANAPENAARTPEGAVLLSIGKF